MKLCAHQQNWSTKQRMNCVRKLNVLHFAKKHKPKWFRQYLETFENICPFTLNTNSIQQLSYNYLFLVCLLSTLTKIMRKRWIFFAKCAQNENIFCQNGGIIRKILQKISIFLSKFSYDFCQYNDNLNSVGRLYDIRMCTNEGRQKVMISSRYANNDWMVFNHDPMLVHKGGVPWYNKTML